MGGARKRITVILYSGKFSREKLSRIGRKGAFCGENFHGMLKLGRMMGVACLEFRGENFCGGLENREIRKNFLP